jgi:hypothetical protein
LPRFQTIEAGRHHRDVAKIQHQLQGGVVVLGGIQDQVQGRGQGSNAGQPFAAFPRSRGLTGGESEGYGRSSNRGNHMNLGGPSAA